MSEIIKAKYIDLMVDWSFKRVFGTEVNKDILIEFLKVVFPQFAITDITYIPTEQLGIMEDDRKAIFDVLCKTEDDKTFLVEMQRGAQKHFFERASVSAAGDKDIETNDRQTGVCVRRGVEVRQERGRVGDGFGQVAVSAEEHVKAAGTAGCAERQDIWKIV